MKHRDELNHPEDRVEQAMREALEAEVPGSTPQPVTDDGPEPADQLYIVTIGRYQFWYAYNKAAALRDLLSMLPYASC